MGIKAHFDLLSGILFCGKFWKTILVKIIKTRGFQIFLEAAANQRTENKNFAYTIGIYWKIVFCSILNGNDSRILNLFNRANDYRLQNEFGKALATFESILDEDNTNAEAHWGCVLSKYGIEYVEDPKTHNRIPTCHRVQSSSILVDLDYKKALEYADDSSKELYEKEAIVISEIQKRILAIANQEEAYDIFICYISPTLVKWFGHTEWFKKMWQGKLDRMVSKLQANGVESTPYEDKNW